MARAVAGRFKLGESVGAGGMGTVFDALDTATGQRVAVKVLHADAVVPERFAREAALLAELEHPSIVRYVSHGTEPDGSYYLVMEWVEGASLADRLEDEGLDMRSAVRVARRVAEALGEAHRRGVVHRDVKPDNIMLLDETGDHVRLIDFGIARRIVDAGAYTRTGTLVGTPGYVAPEQARGLRDVDERVDVFALGCVLYESLTGSPAFAGHNLQARLIKALFLEPPPLVALCPEAPPELADLVHRLLMKDPAQRPNDGAAVAAMLDSLPTLPATSPRAQDVAPASATANDTLRTRRDEALCVLLAGRQVGDDGATLITDPEVMAEREARLGMALAPLGAEPHALADGSFVIAVRDRSGTAAIASALRCAERAAAILPTVPLVLISEEGAAPALDAAIDRGTQALADAAVDAVVRPSEAPVRGRAALFIDEPTAKALYGKREIHRDAAVPYILLR